MILCWQTFLLLWNSTEVVYCADNFPIRYWGSWSLSPRKIWWIPFQNTWHITGFWTSLLTFCYHQAAKLFLISNYLSCVCTCQVMESANVCSCPCYKIFSPFLSSVPNCCQDIVNQCDKCSSCLLLFQLFLLIVPLCMAPVELTFFLGNLQEFLGISLAIRTISLEFLFSILIQYCLMWHWLFQGFVPKNFNFPLQSGTKSKLERDSQWMDNEHDLGLALEQLMQSSTWIALSNKFQ